MSLHMIKLVVGCDTIEDLLAWHAGGTRPWVMHTRQTPKRAADLLAGGSLYRVFKGVILCRQRITDLQEVNLGDGIPRCALVLDQEVIRTEAAPRRPFQGWRYLDPKDSPRDLPKGRAKDDPLPPKLAQALAELGLH